MNSSRRSSLTIWLSNVDSLSNKFIEFQHLVDQHAKTDLIFLNETNPKHSKSIHLLSEYQIHGRQILSCGFQKEGYRGIMLFYKESLLISEIVLETAFLEKLCVKVVTSYGLLNILMIYRSPNSSSENNDRLMRLLEEFFCLEGDHLLMGDFNFPDIDWLMTSCSGSSVKIENRFLNFLADRFLSQHVMEPTRFRFGQTAHILDLVVSNDIVENVVCLAPLGSSDHSVVSFNVTCDSEDSGGARTKPCYDLGDYISLNNELDDKLADVLDPSLTLESKWKKFKNALIEVTRKHVPHRLCKKFRFQMTPELHELMKRKHYVWRQIFRYGDTNRINEFKDLRKRVKKLSAKLNIESQNRIAIEFKSNPKLFWNYVQKKTRSKDAISTISVNGMDLIGGKEKAQAFADFFASVYITDSGSEVTPVFNPTVPGVEMEEVQIDINILCSKLKDLNSSKSAGPDGIHPRILKEARETVKWYLKHIFDCSIRSGVVVEDWRTSHVVPLFKKGIKNEVSNYRPVSLTSVCCKILESFIKDHLMAHFSGNNLFAQNQFGFLPSRSTTLQMLSFMDTLTSAVEAGDEVDVIYTDLEKAFDKISHKKLLFKLERYGVHRMVIGWIGSYLSERGFQVRVGGDLSDSLPVTSGVPQGSVLGPLLFIIYINDIYTVCDNLFLFADDTKIYRVISKEEDCSKLQVDVNNVMDWFNRWQMKVNMNKCCALHVGGRHHLNKYQILDLDGAKYEIPVYYSFMDLGIIVDSDLKFKEHILSRVKKANMMLGVIVRNFRHLSDFAFVGLYKSLVRSQLEYGVQVWNPYRQGLIDAIEGVQRRATRVRQSCRGLPYQLRLEKLKLPTLCYRRKRADLILLYKLLTSGMKDLVCSSISVCTYSKTRGHERKLVTRLARKDCRKFFFGNRVVQEWNKLPREVVMSRDVENFKRSLDRFFVNETYSLD